MWLRFYIETFPKNGQNQEMWKCLYIETFPHFQKMTKIRVSIIVSIPHCPTDKALARKRCFHIFEDFFSHKNGQSWSIYHC